MKKAKMCSEDDKFESWEDENLDLNMKLLRGIYANGFETPSPIKYNYSNY